MKARTEPSVNDAYHMSETNQQVTAVISEVSYVHTWPEFLGTAQQQLLEPDVPENAANAALLQPERNQTHRHRHLKKKGHLYIISWPPLHPISNHPLPAGLTSGGDYSTS
jgi:hypothetical protein